MSKKPTGKVGPNSVRMTPNGVEHSWEAIIFPTNKEEIEKYFCQRFVDKMKANGAIFYKVEQNEENNFDFTLTLPGGKVYLDLAEIVLKDGVGNPYENDCIQVKYNDYVEAIHEIVKKKSVKYQSNENTPIHLLLYSTHWRISHNDEIIAILQWELNQYKHAFENIFFYCPLENNDGILRVLYANGKNLVDKVPNSLKEKSYLIFNPQKMELLTK